MKPLLILTGILEIVTGVALLSVPSVVADLLLGAPVADPPAQVVARIAGAALLSIGLSCLMSRRADIASARGLLLSLIVYNVMVVIVLSRAFFIDHMHGIGLWPAAILHVILAAWCIVCMAARKHSGDSGP